jgi:hypothetical protein
MQPEEAFKFLSNGEFAALNTGDKLHYLKCAMEALEKRKDEDALTALAAVLVAFGRKNASSS